MSSSPNAPTGFHILMPPGWMRFQVDDEGRKALISRLSTRLRAAGRPDLDAQARTLVEVQWRQLLSTRTSAVYLPGEHDDQPVTPMSIAAKQFVAPRGSTFDAAIRALARVEVERFDGPYGPILRWMTTQNGAGELAEVRSRLIGYGFELPGVSSGRGMVFLTSVPVVAGIDAELVEAFTELSDTIMETFRWR